MAKKVRPENGASKAADESAGASNGASEASWASWFEAWGRELHRLGDKMVGGDQGRTAEVLLVLHGVATARLTPEEAAEGADLPLEGVEHAAAVITAVLRGLLVPEAKAPLRELAQVAEGMHRSDDRWAALAESVETVLHRPLPVGRPVAVWVKSNPLAAQADTDAVIALIADAKAKGTSPNVVASRIAALAGNRRSPNAVAMARKRARQKRI